MIYIGADHRGYQLKEILKKYLEEKGHILRDTGAFEYNKEDDYVDFASAVAERVSKNPGTVGIVICRNGVGVDVTANKFKNVRSVLGFDAEQVRLARNDDDANILALPSEFVTEKQAKEIVDIFLKTRFQSQEKYIRRLNKLKELEK